MGEGDGFLGGEGIVKILLFDQTLVCVVRHAKFWVRRLSRRLQQCGRGNPYSILSPLSTRLRHRLFRRLVRHALFLEFDTELTSRHSNSRIQGT